MPTQEAPQVAPITWMFPSRLLSHPADPAFMFQCWFTNPQTAGAPHSPQDDLLGLFREYISARIMSFVRRMAGGALVKGDELNCISFCFSPEDTGGPFMMKRVSLQPSLYLSPTGVSSDLSVFHNVNEERALSVTACVHRSCFLL